MSTQNPYQPPQTIVQTDESQPLQPLFGKLGTGLLTVFTMVGFVTTQLITLFVALALVSFIMPSKIATADDPMTLIATDGTVLSFSVCVTLFVLSLYCVFIIKIRKKSLKQYFPLTGFGLKIGLIGLGLWVLYAVASEAMFYWLQLEPMNIMDNYFASAEPLWLLIIAIVLIAPIYEELIFRGFLWQAIFEQFADESKAWWVASLITGLLFALIHLQYNVFEVSSIFVLAILFGYLRYRSGSLWLPIIIHVLNNGVAMATYIYAS